jgi:hypothetical protein
MGKKAAKKSLFNKGLLSGLRGREGLENDSGQSALENYVKQHSPKSTNENAEDLGADIHNRQQTSPTDRSSEYASRLRRITKTVVAVMCRCFGEEAGD